MPLAGVGAGGSTGSCRASLLALGSSFPSGDPESWRSSSQKQRRGYKWDWSPTKALLPMAGSMLMDSPLLAPAGPRESQLRRAAHCNGPPSGVASWPAWPTGSCEEQFPSSPYGPCCGTGTCPTARGVSPCPPRPAAIPGADPQHASCTPTSTSASALKPWPTTGCAALLRSPLGGGSDKEALAWLCLTKTLRYGALRGEQNRVTGACCWDQTRIQSPDSQF